MAITDAEDEIMHSDYVVKNNCNTVVFNKYQITQCVC